MIRDKHVYKEILSPEDVAKQKDAPILLLIYKALYMCIRLLIDIRRYTVPKEAYLSKTSEKENV